MCLFLSPHLIIMGGILQFNSHLLYLYRDIWVDGLSEAIKFATSAHADSYLLVGNKGNATYYHTKIDFCGLYSIFLFLW